MTVIKGVDIFLDIAGSRRCIRVFKLIVYLGIRAHSVVLFGHLYICNLLLLKGPSCLIVTVFYEVSIGFLFRSLRNLREE